MEIGNSASDNFQTIEKRDNLRESSTRESAINQPDRNFVKSSEKLLPTSDVPDSGFLDQFPPQNECLPYLETEFQPV